MWKSFDRLQWAGSFAVAGCNWLAHVAADWRRGTFWSESAERASNYPHESTLSRLHILESALLEMQTRTKTLEAIWCKYILRAWEPSKGVETLCETENVSTRTIPRWALFAKSPITFPITGWQGLGGGIQNNWRPLGRLLCTIIYVHFGSRQYINNQRGAHSRGVCSM